MIPNVIDTRHARAYVYNGRSEAQHNSTYGLVILEPIGLMHFLNFLRKSVSRNTRCGRRRRCLGSISINRVTLNAADNQPKSLGLKVTAEEQMRLILKSEIAIY